jgi:mannose-6-phosphate isomerase-like protein (cupin superfamily)
MSNIPDDHIKWYNILDNLYGVLGIAIVKKGFEPPLHRHKEKEIYIFLKGKAKLYIDGYISIIQSPAIITIEPNCYHAMTPISKYVILLYTFPQSGPFKNIKYTFLNSKL